MVGHMSKKSRTSGFPYDCLLQNSLRQLSFTFTGHLSLFSPINHVLKWHIFNVTLLNNINSTCIISLIAVLLNKSKFVITYLTSVPHDLFNFSSMVFGRAHRSLATRVTSLLIQCPKLMHPIGG